MISHSVDAPPLPLLITGVAGVAGYNAVDYFRRRYPGQVIALRQRDNWRLVGDGIVVCNAEDRDGLARLFAEHRFRSVLDCAGNCALKSCQLDPAMAWRINVAGVGNLVDVAEQYDARLVHLSVDLVYSGLGNGGHVETDPTDPVTVYGETMVAAEELILERMPAACILRISLPMGISFNGHAGAIDWIGSRFKKGKPATLYFDEIRTPSYTDCMNMLCEVALASQLAGLYHAGGQRRLSLFEIAQIVNRVGGYDPHLLHGCNRIEAGPVPPRAGNVSLDSSKLAAALGYDPLDAWPFDRRYVPTHRRWHFERPADEPGSAELLASILYRNPRRHAARLAAV
ncbi:MAG TPA: sugar nucleotide-binding protein [Pirellulales bacterium]|nr:sugar nucleotide-binding protein [Pirellulales bacterium]